MNSARIISKAAKAEQKRAIGIVESTIPNHPLYRKCKAELIARIKGEKV